MRKPLIAGNWKMNNSLADARALMKAVLSALPADPGVDVLVCPPVQLLFPMAKAVAGTSVMLGAQTAHEEDSGAFTGEVSVPMIKETGATFVIVGHSERRHVLGETPDQLARKLQSVVRHDLTAIYCVGETLAQREAGETIAVLQQQMEQGVTKDVQPERLVVAYEPVWAIGTGKTATPEQAQEGHALIRSCLASTYGEDTAQAIRILYGGSVKPGNAGGLVAKPDIDGALVGGASLVAEDFVGIINAAAAVLAAA